MEEAELHAKGEQLILALRDIGLYEDKVQWDASHGKPVLLLEMTIGSVAFSLRVQDPPTEDFDAMLREMNHEAYTQTFAEIRQNMLDATNKEKEQ